MFKIVPYFVVKIITKFRKKYRLFYFEQVDLDETCEW